MGRPYITKVLPMNLLYLLKHSDLFPAVVGMSLENFNKLLPLFDQRYRQCMYHRLWRRDRQRALGAGRRSVLQTSSERLLFILFFYKTYPTFRLAQVIFGVDKETIHRWKIFFEEVLWLTLGHELTLPKKKIRTMAGMLEIYPDLSEFILDATERTIQRPKKNQEFYYSGKKKKHTIKNQVIIHLHTRRILSVSKTVEGKRHDKQLCKDDGMVLRAPPGATCLTDLGYQGLKEDTPHLRVILPIKKQCKKELSEMDKLTNRTISSVRVRVEHAIGALKYFQILTNRYRGRLSSADLPFRNIAALYNFTRPITKDTC